MNATLKRILGQNSPIVKLDNANLSFMNSKGAEELKEDGKIKIFEINKSKKVVDKNSLLEELYINGRFGGHFGFNWDALNDCLTEYDILGLKAVLFLYYHYKDINRNDFEIFLNIFSEASERYKEAGVAFKLVLLD